MSYIKVFSNKTNVDYFIYQNRVYFKEENNVIVLEENFNRKLFLTKDIPFVIAGIISKKLCIRDKSFLSYFELDSEMQSKVIPLNFQNSIQIKYQKNNSIILRNQINEVEWKIFCINDYGNIIWKQNDNRPFFACGVLNNSVLFSFNEDKTIKMIDVNNGFTKWQHSFSELIGSEKATLRGDIIETKGKLFFVVSGTLFCVDTHSGDILHKFEGLGRPIFLDQDHIYTTKYENILCRINPNTYNLEQWDANQLLKDNGFESIQDHRCTALNGLFYFTQSLGDIKAKLGVLDFDKKELLFKYEFDPQNGAIGSIQVNDNRIFVHTQDNTLHIFEKE